MRRRAEKGALFCSLVGYKAQASECFFRSYKKTSWKPRKRRKNHVGQVDRWKRLHPSKRTQPAKVLAPFCPGFGTFPLLAEILARCTGKKDYDLVPRSERNSRRTNETRLNGKPIGDFEAQQGHSSLYFPEAQQSSFCKNLI